MKLAAAQMDAAMFWERRTPKAIADAAGEPQGTKGVMQQIEAGATKVEGEIETLADLVKISQYLKKKKITQAFLDATPSQFAKLMGILQGNSNLAYDPFVNHQNDLMYLGYKGVKLYNGVTLLFREWEGLTYGSEKLGKAYNFIITPSGKVTVTLNGQKKQMGYEEKKKLEDNIILLGAKKNPYPYFKISDCVILTSDYEGYPVVFLESFILNKPIITTKVSDYEQVEGKYGYVTDKSIEDIYEKMKLFIEKGFDKNI